MILDFLVLSIETPFKKYVLPTVKFWNFFFETLVFHPKPWTIAHGFLSKIAFFTLSHLNLPTLKSWFLRNSQVDKTQKYRPSTRPRPHPRLCPIPRPRPLPRLFFVFKFSSILMFRANTPYHNLCNFYVGNVHLHACALHHSKTWKMLVDKKIEKIICN